MPNTDIRISVEFWEHPKTVKLEKKLGLEAVKALTQLWMWSAKNRPDGDLSGMDDEDIEIAAKWHGEQGALASALCGLRWLDGEANGRSLHGWEDNNPWAEEAGAEMKGMKNQKGRGGR